MRIALFLLATSLFAQQPWVATWGTAQQQYRAAGRGPVTAPPTPQPAPPPPNPGAPGRRFPVPPALPDVNNQTVRMIVRTSIGGRSVRIRLANALGAPSINLG